MKITCYFLFEMFMLIESNLMLLDYCQRAFVAILLSLCVSHGAGYR